MQNAGILPLRLFEPATSLEVTPFAGKAIRATNLSSMRELAEFVFEHPEECRTMGQAHLDEIRQKIEQFVGRPPFAKTSHLDLGALLRLFLLDLDPQDRAFFLLYTNLISLVPISTSLSKEVQMPMIRNKEERFSRIMTTIRSKSGERLQAILRTIFEGIVFPYVTSLGSIIHREEFHAFIHFRSSLLSYTDVHQVMRILGLVMGDDFLFESAFFKGQRGLYALSEESRKTAAMLLEIADTLCTQQYQNAADLAYLLSKKLFIRRSRIRNLLFWSYRPHSAGRAECGLSSGFRIQ